ncbi:MAG: hypothetical protein KJ799_08120 [Bacteroidetes bacterium]|nr:hypothetical protein [Bacteroidota bacterium]
MIKNKFLIIFTFVSLSLQASGGSIYTRTGIGDVVHHNFGRGFGLGLSGIALADNGYIGGINPATWYKLDMTRFDFGLDYSGFSLTDQNSSAYYSDYSFSGFNFGIPIERDLGITAVIGLQPVTNVKYEVENIINDPILGELSSTYGGNGGLSKMFLGSTYKFANGYVIGASLEYYTGTIEYNSSIAFTGSSSYNPAEYTQLLSFSGNGLSLGILSNDLLNTIEIGGVKDFRLGAYFNYINTLNTDSSLIGQTSAGVINPESEIFDTKIPYKIGLGASFYYYDNFLIAFDYIYQPWSNYEIHLKKDSNLRDLHRVSLGAEYTNPDKRISSAIWEQITLRFGLTFEQTQYEINGEGINQFLISTGFAYPLGVGNTIDFGFQYGKRGTTNSNLIQEDIFKAALSISFGELWFIRHER